MTRKFSLGDVMLVHDPPKDADASFWEWMRDTWREEQGKPADVPLCAGARIVVDEDGKGTLTVDPDLPDGVWLITRDGKTMRCEGVHGPTRMKSLALESEDIEVSPVAITFETRKP